MLLNEIRNKRMIFTDITDYRHFDVRSHPLMTFAKSTQIEHQKVYCAAVKYVIVYLVIEYPNVIDVLNILILMIT